MRYPIRLYFIIIIKKKIKQAAELFNVLKHRIALMVKRFQYNAFVEEETAYINSVLHSYGNMNYSCRIGSDQNGFSFQ